MLIIIFVMAMGVKPSRVNSFFSTIAVLFGVYMFGTLISTIIFIANSTFPAWVSYIMLGTSSCFALGVLLHCAVMTILKGVLHYLFLTPTYVNVFLIYSICNIHDCTWGNRPDLLSAEEKNRIEEFEEFRTRWLIFWVLCNTGYITMLQIVSDSNTGGLYVYSIALLATGIVLLRFFGCLAYLVHENCCKRKLKRQNESKIVPAANRASATINKIENLNRSIRRSSSIKPDRVFQLTEKGATGQMITDAYEFKEEPEVMKRKSKRFENEGAKVDGIIVEEFQTFSESPLLIREKRFKRGITMKKLADLTGLPINKLRDIEEGRDLSTANINKVLDALKGS